MKLVAETRPILKVYDNNCSCPKLLTEYRRGDKLDVLFKDHLNQNQYSIISGMIIGIHDEFITIDGNDGRNIRIKDIKKTKRFGSMTWDDGSDT